jgi:hypothetical protein
MVSDTQKKYALVPKQNAPRGMSSAQTMQKEKYTHTKAVG